MTTIAELKAALAAAEESAVEDLHLEDLGTELAASDRRLERLEGQLRTERAKRRELETSRDERLRRGADVGVSTTRLAEASGLSRARVSQILAKAPKATAVAAEEPPAEPSLAAAFPTS